MQNKAKLIPAVFIALAPMVLLYPIWQNPVSAGEDDVIFYYPLRKMVGQALRQGRLPLHNPLEATGMALMADPQSAVMYPPTWLFAVLEPKLAYSLSIFLAFSLAGGGGYLYLRRLGLARQASTFGAAAFMFCGFMVGHRVHLGMIHTACWLPWILWRVEKLREMKATRRAAARAFCWTAAIAYLAITAGHWPTLIQMSVVCLAYFFLRARPLVGSLAVAGLALVVACMLAGPQIAMSAELLARTTRQRIGYATAGENSFFPAAAVLALFPMIMGTRTPNFYPQKWWGPWHQCEMLGYVGLITLVLAAAGVWKLCRRQGSSAESSPSVGDGPDPSRCLSRHGNIFRVWVWIAAGAFVWMLGYYLPTYRLIHMLPVLGVVRCPGRMMLALDLALATMAAVALDRLMDRGQAGGTLPAAKTCRRVAAIWLPLAMLAVLVIMTAAGKGLGRIWPDRIPFFVGGAKDMALAVTLANPAVWVPLAVAVATGVAVRYWLKSRTARAWLLVGLLLGDLATVACFVDFPPANRTAADPDDSPAARWLEANGPAGGTYRVWSLGESYYDRPDELLLPKTCQAMGLASLASYGPFQSPDHAHLLGLRIFGNSRDWARLIRTNYLLSLYNVRYVLAAEAKFRSVIESVSIPENPPAPPGPEILTGKWSVHQAELDGRIIRLRTPVLWRLSSASQPVNVEPGRIYRISLDARGPDGGAANFLRAEVFQIEPGGRRVQSDQLGLTAYSEQIVPQWRHFEWTFKMPDQFAGRAAFRVFTMSERPIEVRNVSLRPSRWETPFDLTGQLPPGRSVYVKRAELPSRTPGKPAVAIYENLLCLDDTVVSFRRMDNNEIERLKWSPEISLGHPPAAADVSVRVGTSGQRALVLASLSVTAAGAYIIGLALAGLMPHKPSACRKDAQTSQAGGS